jgi:F-type H+-transporting ATPase subunit gamma
MKVVASTKLTRAERAMREAKKYGAANNQLFTNSASSETPETAPKILYLAMTSDGGLCGGIHSGITRAVKRAQAEAHGMVAVVGDKPRAQLSRAMPQDFKVTFGGVGKDVPTFAEASVIADEIMKNGGEFDEVSNIFDRYVI